MPAEQDISQIEMPNQLPNRAEIPNALAKYPGWDMLEIFSPENKVRDHQSWWTEVAQGQHDLGLNIPQEHIDDYRSVQDQVDLVEITRVEYETRHDEKAMVQTFNKTAGGHEDIQRGMTSRDNSDNIEQRQIKRALNLLLMRSTATLARFGKWAGQTAEIYISERSHNVPGQPSLLAKLFSNFGEEVLHHHKRLERLIEDYPLRGLKGAMGTQTDQLQLFDGDEEKVDELESRLVEFLGFENVMNSTGQVYPRSLDHEVVTAQYGLIGGISSLAITLRLMAGRDQFSEGFLVTQTGSAGMPHKTNARTLERIKALKAVLAGHVTMAGAVTGEQWHAGDVSESAARRVFIPDSFFATDGIFQCILTVLDECEFYPAVIDAELEKYLPFLTSTRFLMAATKNGLGREKAHEIIKKHSVAVAKEMKRDGLLVNDLVDRLANDPELGLTKEHLLESISDREAFVGTAPRQVTRFIQSVEEIVAKNPDYATYKPDPIR